MSTPLSDSQRLTIGIDVGGTKIAGALIATSMQSQEQHNPPTIKSLASTPAHLGAQALIHDIANIIRELTQLQDISVLKSQGIHAIGIGTPGRVNYQTGTVDNIVNLDITHIELRQEIYNLTGVPVYVENDVNAAALGANAIIPAGNTPHATSVFLNLGTGLAAGVIRHGTIDHGYSNAIGEIGHIPLEPHQWACPCGQTGCLETAGSGGAATRLWARDNPPMPALIAKAQQPNSPDYEEAKRTLQIIVNAIVNSIIIIAVTIDPERIIIGGGMAKTGEPLLQVITQGLRERASDSGFINSLHLAKRVSLADSAQPVGVIGAALLSQAQDLHNSAL